MKEFLANKTIAPLIKNQENVRPENGEIKVDIDTKERVWKKALDKLFFPLGPVTIEARKPRGTAFVELSETRNLTKKIVKHG